MHARAHQSATVLAGRLCCSSSRLLAGLLGESATRAALTTFPPPPLASLAGPPCCSKTRWLTAPCCCASPRAAPLCFPWARCACWPLTPGALRAVLLLCMARMATAACTATAACSCWPVCASSRPASQLPRFKLPRQLNCLPTLPLNRAAASTKASAPAMCCRPRKRVSVCWPSARRPP